jgi:5-methylcytosine-specific restriction endonuclease McrA
MDGRMNIIERWLPLPTIHQLHPPAGFKDYQVAWFWNLFWASLKSANMGYLPLSEDLWKVAGALNRERWEAGKSVLLGAFDIIEHDGEKLLYFPPLKAVIEQNLKMVRRKKSSRADLEDLEVSSDQDQGEITPMSRKGMGPRMRFEILKRDAFTCQYCGRRTPEVQLEVDHIIPVVEGGATESDNLITACHGCNRGKAGLPLEPRGSVSA